MTPSASEVPEGIVGWVNINKNREKRFAWVNILDSFVRIGPLIAVALERGIFSYSISVNQGEILSCLQKKSTHTPIPYKTDPILQFGQKNFGFIFKKNIFA